MKVTRKKLRKIIYEAMDAENFLQKLGFTGSQILQVKDPKVKEGIFTLGIKDKTIKLFYVLGDEIREITPASDEFAKSLSLMQDEISKKGSNKEGKLWKQFIKNIYPNAPFKNIKTRLKNI
jgi:hypothetical protein